MNVPQINLLPWREPLYARRRRDTLAGIGVAVFAGLFGAWLVARSWHAQIAELHARGDSLRAQIALLDARARELEPARQRVTELGGWLAAMDALQRRQIAGVALFEELARRLPDAVHYTSWRQAGERVELRGAAESSAQITALLHQLDASPWLHDPQLLVVESVRDAAGTRSTFLIQVRQHDSAMPGPG